MPRDPLLNDRLELEVRPDADAVARRAAAFIADEARVAVGDRGAFLLAISGGRTPLQMLEILAREDVPWEKVHLFQVDERIAPEGDPLRNLTRLRAGFLNHVPVPENQVHPMPVETTDTSAAAEQYESTLHRIAGSPPTFDLIHLGLGSDGHTASLFAGDDALESTNGVAVTDIHQGTRRMTLTYPVLDRARKVLWVVTGNDKKDALARLMRGDRSIPAARVSSAGSYVVADRAAAAAMIE